MRALRNAVVRRLLMITTGVCFWAFFLEVLRVITNYYEFVTIGSEAGP